LASSIAAMTVSLGGLDVLVFTGGVGEHSVEIRRRAGTRLRHLGIEIDDTLNRAVEEGSVQRAESDVAVLVVTSREDLEIARNTESLLRGAG
jgi:acetate kinase